VPAFCPTRHSRYEQLAHSCYAVTGFSGIQTHVFQTWIECTIYSLCHQCHKVYYFLLTSGLYWKGHSIAMSEFRVCLSVKLLIILMYNNLLVDSNQAKSNKLNIRQLMHGGECDIQIWHCEFEMSTRGPVDISSAVTTHNRQNVISRHLKCNSNFICGISFNLFNYYMFLNWLTLAVAIFFILVLILSYDLLSHSQLFCL